MKNVRNREFAMQTERVTGDQTTTSQKHIYIYASKTRKVVKFNRIAPRKAEKVIELISKQFEIQITFRTYQFHHKTCDTKHRVLRCVICESVPLSHHVPLL